MADRRPIAKQSDELIDLMERPHRYAISEGQRKALLAALHWGKSRQKIFCTAAETLL